MGKTSVILINTGSPARPDVPSVRKYLFRFLNDRSVIDLPLILQKILVNLIIVPFRTPKSTEKYKLLWTEEGFPLVGNTSKLADKLQNILGANFKVYYAMRYGNPGLKDLLRNIEKENFDEIIFLPLFPQYASSTTGSINRLVLDELSNWNSFPNMKFINHFYDEPGFINAFVSQIVKYQPENYEHIIFSFHGLPVNHINKIHPQVQINTCSCKKEMPEHGAYCYKAQCYETARRIASGLGLNETHYTIAFQSRLTKNWLTPFTDSLIIEKAKQGLKKLLIIAPSFVSDCLETTVELKIEYGDLFRANGGEQLDLVESLNYSDEWAEALSKIIVNCQLLIVNCNKKITNY
ncbi:MAG: hemH [Ignavibacteria bacterium]|nr:hemH [Ignavibacteria bacterium]